MTYDELSDKSYDLVSYLSANAVVCYLPRSTDLAVSMLASWRAIRPVLHLDPAHIPPALLVSTLEQLDGAVVICRAGVQLDLPEGVAKVELPLVSRRRVSTAGTGEYETPSESDASD